MPSMGMRFDLHGALSAWQRGPFSILVAAALVGIGYWYLRADWRLATRGRRWPAHRTAFFVAGLVAVDLAIESPVATYANGYFQAHVIQHLLLMVIAPPLLALGAPSTLLLQTSGRRVKTAWLRILRSRPFQLLTFPVTVWALYFGVMFAFFLSSLLGTAMLHPDLMDCFNLLFLFGGTLYWWPMVGLDPIVHWRMGYGARMVNVLLGAPPEVVLGLALVYATHSAAPMYSLASTHDGGALLWVSTEAATVLGFLPIFWQWVSSDERAARRADAIEAATPATGRVIGAALEGTTSANPAWEAYWRARTGSVPRRAARAVRHPN